MARRATAWTAGLLAAGVAAATWIASGTAAAEGDPAAAATAAEDASRKLGAKVFEDKALGAGERSCATCHDNPKKPELSLKGVAGRWPRYEKSAGRVLSLQEKFVQMQEKSLKAKKTLPLGDERWTALEMHLKSLK
jgi:mono/diheme cytochrome c family protein